MLPLYCRYHKLLGDTEKPAEEVLKDSQMNAFLHKQQGEPISVCESVGVGGWG